MRLSLFFLAGAAALAAEERMNPMRRVINILQKMQKDVTEEGEKETELFEKFQCFCKGSTSKMQKEMEENQAAVKQQQAQAEADSAKKAQLEEELKQHRADREAAKDAIAQAEGIRNKEKEAFDKETGDMKANLDAMDAAIKALQKGMALVQVSSRATGIVTRLVQASDDIAPEQQDEIVAMLQGKASAGGAADEIVGILKQMKDRFDSDLGGAIATEEAAVKTFNELTAAKRKEIAAATKAIEKKQVRVGELAVSAVEAKNAANSAGDSAAELEAFLADLAENCAAKKKEYDERVKNRNEELMALADALKVLTDDDALDIFKGSMSLAQKPVFLQLANGSPRKTKKDALMLLDQALSMNSHRDARVSAILVALRTRKVDFSKVITMIDDMVALLKQEQTDDNTHREHCNAELKRTADAKRANEHKQEDLQTAIEADKDAIATLEDEIAELQRNIADLNKQVAEATEDRKEENAEFVKTKGQDTACLQILDLVINRLNKFYNPALYKPPPERQLTEEERLAVSMGETLTTPPPQLIAGTNFVLKPTQPPSFIQTSQPEAPETWSGGGKRDSHGSSAGVMKLLDNAKRDVEKGMKEAEMDENQSQKEYEKFMADATAQNKKDGESVTEKEVAKGNLEGRLSDAKTEVTATLAEYQTLGEEIAALNNDCTFLLQNFEVRREARSNEIEGLKQAKAVLSGADYGFIQAPDFIQVSQDPKPEAEAAEEMTKDLEVNFNKIAPFGKEDTAHELQSHASKTQDTLVDAVENAEVAEIKRAVFRALTRLRAATIKEFDTIARLETQAIDAYNDAHHYRAENPLTHLHDDEAPVPTDKLKSFH